MNQRRIKAEKISRYWNALWSRGNSVIKNLSHSKLNKKRRAPETRTAMLFFIITDLLLLFFEVLAAFKNKIFDSDPDESCDVKK